MPRAVPGTSKSLSRRGNKKNATNEHRTLQVSRNKILLLGGHDRQTKRLTDFHVSRLLPSSTLWDPCAKTAQPQLIGF